MQKSKTMDELEEILTTRICSSQAEIQRELAKHHITVTQASISRMLQRVGAVKTELPNGTIAYRLHKGSVIQRHGSTKLSRTLIAQHLADRIIGNGAMYIILGKPDSGRYLGTYVDDAAFPSIAGTIAGGNTLLVVPQSIKRYSKTAEDLKLLFPNTPLEKN